MVVIFLYLIIQADGKVVLAKVDCDKESKYHYRSLSRSLSAIMMVSPLPSLLISYSRKYMCEVRQLLFHSQDDVVVCQPALVCLWYRMYQ